MIPETKTTNLDGVEYKYSAAWIRTLESETHWRLYWRQQKLMQGLISPGQHILEIGVGSGFTANYLRSKGVKVTTLDIDADKKPDIVANVVNYDFPQKYDHVLGFEVFEHIPFEKFMGILPKLATICQGHLFMSVPRNDRLWLRSEFQLPRVGTQRFEITTPRSLASGSNHHFWEVGHGKVTLAFLKGAITNAGFTLIRQEKAFSRLFFAFRTI